MTLIRANIQTVDDMYRLVWTAVSKKQPIEARYAERTQLATGALAGPKPGIANIELFTLVGAARFELTTPCAQGRCATRLRYAPTLYLSDSKTLRSNTQSLS